jgi:PIN domain nuclease of toxin-antitoxin system
MPLPIRAQVVDIRSDTPRAEDVFVVDTNVWYWLVYPQASLSSKDYQVQQYPAYINAARKKRSTLHAISLAYTELAHSIERSECNIIGKEKIGKISPSSSFAAIFRKTVPLLAR